MINHRNSESPGKQICSHSAKLFGLASFQDNLLKKSVGRFRAVLLFYGMEMRYATLKTVYEIAIKESNPLNYACFPNQIILHQSQPWDIIIKQLNELAAEELITIQQPGTTVCITAKGMEKATTGMFVL